MNELAYIMACCDQWSSGNPLKDMTWIPGHSVRGYISVILWDGIMMWIGSTDALCLRNPPVRPRRSEG